MTAFLEQLIIRPYIPSDENAVWMILEPVIASGDTYALPTIWNRQETIAFWCMAGHEVRAGPGNLHSSLSEVSA